MDFKKTYQLSVKLQVDVHTRIGYCLWRGDISMRKSIFVTVIIMLMGVLFFTAAANAREITKEELKKALNDNPDVVLDFLRAHPVEVYDVAEAGIKAKEAAEKRERLDAQLAKPLKPVIDESRILAGPSDAPVTVVVYSDFFCPYCARAAKTMDALMAAHPGQARLIFKHMPAHDGSKTAALYFEAILKQSPEKAKKFHDLVFASQAELMKTKEEGLKKLAAETGADMARVAVDMKSRELSERLAADDKESRAFGFQGTPTFIVNGVSLEGAQPLKEFEDIIRLTDKR